MADFTLGLAKTAVEGTLSRVQSAINEETKLKAAAQQDLVFITGEFQMMQSFLKVATKERAGNEVVKTWVRQLRDLAFDVEDCVEFVIHLDNDSAMSWVWRLVPSCMAPPWTRELDEAVAELKQLKARVEEVSQRNTRYNLISDSGSNPVSQPPTEKLATTGPSTIDILMELWEANGRHHGFCNLQKLITNEGNDLQVISSWGSAGSDIEGTGIISMAYHDPEICHRFKSRAWVKVMHPFNPDEFLKNLQTRLQASSRSCQAVDFNGKILEDDPVKQLIEQRYLVILEGISSVVEWEIIRMYLPDNNNGSRIVVSTKKIRDAIFITEHPYRVSVLTEFTGGHYLCAFYKKGSGRRNVMCDLIRLLGRPGVISVWGIGDDKSTLVRELFNSIPDENKEKINSQSECILYGWVDVTYPFNLEDFYMSLLRSFHKDDKESAVDMKEGFLHFYYQHHPHCVVVINGLQSTEEWQLIEDKFESECIKGHIIVITNGESLATSCVDHEYRALNVNNMVLHPSMQIHGYMNELFWRLRHRRVISLCGAGGDALTLLKQVYNGIKHQHVGFKEVEKFEYYVWVDIPHPFDEREFLLRLVKEFFPDVDADDYVEFVESFLREPERKLIFIINGLQSTAEWEFIKPYLLGGDTDNCVILIANEDSVSKHFIEHLEANPTIRRLTKTSDYYGNGDKKEASRSIFLSNRRNDFTVVRGSREQVCAEIEKSLGNTGVTSVWGIAGVGKSDLVRKRCDEAQDTDFCPFKRFAWVNVPPGPFDLVEFSRLLLLDFHRCDLQAMEVVAIGILQGHDPIQGCCEILRQGQYLIVIDGLWSTYDWDVIKTAFLSQPTIKGKIVVITIEERIAKHCVKQQADQMINVKCLEGDESCLLFGELIRHNELGGLKGKVDLAKLMAKCGGFPKVVSAITEVPPSFLEHMNDDFMFKLETDPQFHSLSGLLSWMHSYFDACSDLVKPCIYYLSIFSASSKIRRGRLVRRWIAEGYSRDAPGCTARENAQKRFSELVKLSIIQQATSQAICQVNGFFREYIISRPMEDNLVFALDGRRSSSTQRAGKHLTIMADWHRDQIAFESIDFARLRSLTIFGKWYSFFISGKMKRLRVLDLEGMVTLTNEDIEQIFVKLLSLKFISLRGCREISHVPDTLGGLRQLQTLDVRLTSIVKLPSAIVKLHKLQYIRAGAIVLPDEDWKSASTEYGDVVTNQLPETTSEELDGRDSSISSGPPAVPKCTENFIAESPAQATTSQEAQHRPMVPKVRRLAHTWSLYGSKPKKEAQHHNGGVGVPVGIVKLAALHTVGVVNVNASGGVAFLKQLSKLTQLLKLRVCGINKKNWPLLCSALSDKNCHLESLSVRFDEDCLDDSFKPPKTLKSLKLYGPITRLPEVTMKVLVNLRKLDLEMTITSPDDIHLFLKDKLPRRDILNRLCIKVQGDKVLNFSSSEFQYGDWSDCFHPRVVKIDCSSKLEVTVGVNIISYAEVLIIQCYEGSFFRVSGGHDGLTHMCCLKTVWLKGSYSEEQRVHLKKLVDCHYKQPVFKLEPLQ